MLKLTSNDNSLLNSIEACINVKMVKFENEDVILVWGDQRFRLLYGVGYDGLKIQSEPEMAEAIAEIKTAFSKLETARSAIVSRKLKELLDNVSKNNQ